MNLRPLVRWRDEAAVAALLGLLAAALCAGGAWRLDRLVYDLGLSWWQRPPPPQIVIVAIDDASVEAIGRWPWRRAVHATLLAQLAAARPKAIALDLVLSEPDPDPAQDRLLAAALQRAAPVVVPVAWGQAGGMLVALEPAPLLKPAVVLGAADAAVDGDGVLRHAYLEAGPAGAPYPQLALALLRAGGEAPHPTLAPQRAPATAAATGWRRDGEYLVRFAGPPGTVARVSYVDVLSGAVPAAQLAGRYLLVGMTAQGLGDTLATPVNGRHQAMPGVEVLANTLYTLRSGDTLAEVAMPVRAAGSAAAVMALVAAFARLGPRAALPVAIGSLPLALAASLLALRGGLWFSPVPYALAALLAYPLWSWRRLEFAVRSLDREIARLDADTAHAGELPARENAAPAAPDPPDPSEPPNRRHRHDRLEARLRALRRAGALVREARRLLADALAAMPTAMLVADARSRVVLANPRAAALFEVGSAAELDGLDLPRLLAEFETPEPIDWVAALAALPPGADGLAVEARLAGIGDFVVHVAALAEASGPLRLVVGIADIAPVRQAEREREEALAFVSHDLRSPASAIVMLADLELQGRRQSPPQELLAEVRRLAARTLAMSEDFVRTAHARTQPLQREPVPARELLDAALADHRAQAEGAGIALGIDDGAAPDRALAVRAEVDRTLVVREEVDRALVVNAEVDRALVVRAEVDRALVVRALGNLVANALRHSPPGGRVVLAARAGDRELELSVRDSGPGLAEAQLAQLAAGDEGLRAGDARGIGLGLRFVQRVARRHGGRLEARNAEGGGALFVLVLPRSGNP